MSMKVAVEPMTGCKRRLAVEAPSDVVQQAWEKAYGRVQKQVRLTGFRKGHAQFRAVERAAAPGDLVIVDYTLAPEGHDATSATGYEFIVGSGAVLAEIDQAVVGMSAGQELNVPLRFAADHRMESLRDKSGT